MPTKDGLTKARDAAIDCVEQTTAFHLNVRMAVCGIRSDAASFEQTVRDWLKELESSRDEYDRVVTTDVIDAITASNAANGKLYQIGEFSFETAHKAARRCADQCLSLTCIFDVAKFDRKDPAVLMRRYSDEFQNWSPWEMKPAIEIEWAEAVRQLDIVTQISAPQLRGDPKAVADFITANPGQQIKKIAFHTGIPEHKVKSIVSRLVVDLGFIPPGRGFGAGYFPPQKK